MFDSFARMVLNLASSGTAVYPIGFSSLAFNPEVNLSTSWTAEGSSGLKECQKTPQLWGRSVNSHFFKNISPNNIKIPARDRSILALSSSLDVGELFKVATRSDDMAPIDDLMSIVMIVAKNLLA